MKFWRAMSLVYLTLVALNLYVFLISQQHEATSLLSVFLWGANYIIARDLGSGR